MAVAFPMKWLLCLPSLLLCGWLLAPASHKLPTHLKINDLDWHVRVVDDFPSDDDLLGWTDMPKREILLRRGMCVEEERDTLWHEIHHALMGHDFSDAKFTGHQAIYILTPPELHILRDNPELAAYLTAK